MVVAAEEGLEGGVDVEVLGECDVEEEEVGGEGMGGTPVVEEEEIWERLGAIVVAWEGGRKGEDWDSVGRVVGEAWTELQYRLELGEVCMCMVTRGQIFAKTRILRCGR